MIMNVHDIIIDLMTIDFFPNDDVALSRVQITTEWLQLSLI